MIDGTFLDGMPPSSNHQIGNYRLTRLLGHGGFASVYLGEHIYLKRLAAIKLVRTSLTNRDKVSFLAEARLLAQLSHPHIIRVLEFAVTQHRDVIRSNSVREQLPFLVMDYAPGGSLRSLYPPHTRLPLNDVVNNINQVAAALQYAHDQNIIHRDIKPENLLMNERQEIMLSDFGLALFAPSPDLLSLQGLVGTLPYTAPEQLQGKPVFASDQYSLGILTYEWLSGSRPFQGGDVEIIMQHISSSPPPLHTKSLAIPQAVEDIILKALAKHPGHRYQTVLAFAHALEDASRSHRSFSFTRPTLVAVNARMQEKREFPAFRYLIQKNFREAPDGNPVPPPARDFATVQHPTMLSTPARRNRRHMLQKVRAYWIQGVLEKSLHGASFITLEMDEKPDIVGPQRSSVLQAAQPSQPRSVGTSISEIFDQAGGDLLILGEPGAGKTTLMLQLTRSLLAHADLDETLPLPVVFLLSTWAEKQQPLEEWLIEELNDKYQVPHILGERWVNNDIIFPLLDGLDEVAADARSACVTAINSYIKEHGLSPLVVCSRFSEYILFPPRVLLQNAVVVRPLTLQQIHEYFSASGQKFAGIAQILREDPAFQRLVTTPLMLNIITLAYQDKSPDDLLHLSSPHARYNRILHTFVEQMLLRHAIRYPEHEFIHQLGYLATQMQEFGEKVFYIEHIQPQWMHNTHWEQLYRYVAAIVPGTLIGALTGILSNVLLFHAGSIGSVYIDAVYGTIMGYFFSTMITAQAPYKQESATSTSRKRSIMNSETPIIMVIGVITFLGMVSDKGWAAALANALFMGGISPLLSIFFEDSNRARSHTRDAQVKQNKERKKFFPTQHITNGTLIGIACGLTSVITIIVTPAGQPTTLTFLLTLGIRDSLRNALLGSLLSLLLASNDGLIHPAEIISWSWKRFMHTIKEVRSIFFELLIGIVVGVIFASKQLFQGNINGASGVGISTGLLVALSFHLIYAIFQSISSRNLDDHHRARPNEGIRRSLSHGLAGGAISIPIIIMLSIITTLIATTLGNGLPDAKANKEVITGLRLGLSNAYLLVPCGLVLTTLLSGGLASLQQRILFLLLWMIRGFPLKLVSFLEQAVQCIFLHKVGGGYLFIHRFLLEYFASHDNDIF